MKFFTGILKFILFTFVWLIKTAWSILTRLIGAIETQDGPTRDEPGEIGAYHDLRSGEIHPVKRPGGFYVEDD